MQVNKCLAALLMTIGLTSCAGANLKADCPSAKGVNCQMFSKVDSMISSGEIEEVYKKQNCKSGNCNNNSFMQPDLVDDAVINATYKE